ncbi:MAG: hypothetical protein SEPTF4163_005144 [Sporothrix epigloea]
MAQADFLDNVKKSFADVPIDAANDNAIDTIAFLQASEEMLKLVSAFGVGVDKVVGRDIKGNIDAVRDGCKRNPLHAATLQELYAADAVVREKLMWLMRGLRFVYYALKHDIADQSQKSLPEDKQQLLTAFTESYNKVLAPHHSTLVRYTASTTMKLTLPTAKTFYNTISPSKSLDETRESLKPWVEGLGRIVEIMLPVAEPTSPEYKAKAKAGK